MTTARMIGRRGSPTPGRISKRAAISKLKDSPGHEIVSLNDAQLKEWKTSAEPVYKSWADGVRKAGGDPDTVLKDLRAALDQYKASY